METIKEKESKKKKEFKVFLINYVDIYKRNLELRIIIIYNIFFL
jgi:hypothetical protein